MSEDKHDFPDKCPDCCADLTAYGAVRKVYEEYVYANVGPDGDIETSDKEDAGDPVRVFCADCGFNLWTEGEGPRCHQCHALLTLEGSVNYSSSEDGTGHAVDGTWANDTVENVYELSLSCSTCGAAVELEVLGSEVSDND